MSAKDRILHGVTRSDVVRRTYGTCRSIPVVGSALQKLVHAAIPVGSRLWIRIPQGFGEGLWMYVDPRFELGYANGDYEPWIQDLLKTELRSGGCYYDVGAHSGFFCLIAARCVGPSGTVVAIEADPQNFAILRANTDRNRFAQITTTEAAIWSSAGQLTFQQASDASNRTQGRVSSGNPSHNTSVTVSSMSLDDLVFVHRYRPPDLVKMDIEGAEWEALQGARRVLAEVRPKLLCEIHDPAQLGQIRAYLEQFGYSAEEWKPVHPHYVDYRQIYLWVVPVD